MRERPRADASRRAVCAALASAWVLPLQARPAAVMQGVPNATLRGQGDLRFWGFKVYTAKLWTQSTFEANRWLQHPLALEIEYARAFSGLSIAEKSLDEMRLGGELTNPTAARWLAAMSAAFPDVDAGSRLAAVWSAARGHTTFFANDVQRAVVAEPAFGERFFGIWLAPHSSAPTLRAALLSTAP